MTSKQIGKLRQRIGELVLRQDKTTLGEDFKELENDVALRAAGLEKLSLVSETYIKALSKKKDVDSPEKDKALPIEALGLTMIAHGDEFGDNSIYGSALVNFGRTHVKVASLQEDYAQSLADTYWKNLEAGRLTIQEYRAQRKKLDSRRLSLDAAVSKASKAKKDKDKAEAEEELESARLRYEEMSEEIEDRMLSIQNQEQQQFAEVTEFLELELQFVIAYQDLLLGLKDEWPDLSSFATRQPPRPRIATNMLPREPTNPALPSPTDAYSPVSFSSVRHRKSQSVAHPSRERSHTTSDPPTSSRPSLPRSFTHTRKRTDSLNTSGTRESGGDAASNTSISNAPTSKADKENGGTSGAGTPKKRMSVSHSVSSWMDSLGTSSRSRKNSSHTTPVQQSSKGNFQSLGDEPMREEVEDDIIERKLERTPRGPSTRDRPAPPLPPRRSNDYGREITLKSALMGNESRESYEYEAGATASVEELKYADRAEVEVGGSSGASSARTRSRTSSRAGGGSFSLSNARSGLFGSGAGAKNGSAEGTERTSDSPSSSLLQDSAPAAHNRTPSRGANGNSKKYPSNPRSQSSPELSRFAFNEGYDDEAYGYGDLQDDEEPFGDPHRDGQIVMRAAHDVFDQQSVMPSPHPTSTTTSFNNVNPNLNSSTNVASRPPPPIPFRPPSSAKKPPPPPPARRALSNVNLGTGTTGTVGPHMMLPKIPTRGTDEDEESPFGS